jgi:uncharacterized protein
VILPDVNLLLYAYDESSPFHAKAAAWWQECLSGVEPVGLTTQVLFAFVRIGTSARAFARPMTMEIAAGHVRQWLDQPVSRLVEMYPEDVERALDLLCRAGVGGNLTTDAQLAALSIRHRAVIHSADADFARFPEVTWVNPLTGA